MAETHVPAEIARAIAKAMNALDADPAGNPHQPPADQQAEHHPGARRHVKKDSD